MSGLLPVFEVTALLENTSLVFEVIALTIGSELERSRHLERQSSSLRNAASVSRTQSGPSGNRSNNSFLHHFGVAVESQIRKGT
jgi:hypothetical protein